MERRTIEVRGVDQLEEWGTKRQTVPLHPYDRRPARMQMR